MKIKGLTSGGSGSGPGSGSWGSSSGSGSGPAADEGFNRTMEFGRPHVWSDSSEYVEAPLPLSKFLGGVELGEGSGEMEEDSEDQGPLQQLYGLDYSAAAMALTSINKFGVC